MPQTYISVPSFKSVATGNGSNRGTIAVTAVTGFWPGAFVWLKSDAVAATRFQIVKIVTLTLYLRAAPPPTGGAQDYPKPNYGYSDLSAYTLASNAIVTMPYQLVKTELANTKPTQIV